MKRTRLAAAVLPLLLPLAACSGSGTDNPEDAFADDDRDATEVMQDAVEATLDLESGDIDTRLDLLIDGQEISLEAAGPVDYEAVVGDITIHVDQQGQETRLAVRADGDRHWVSASGPGHAPVPHDKEWVEGPASMLADSDSFTPAGLLGVVSSMVGVEDAEFGDTGERDGVAVREVTATIKYADARDAAQEAGHDLAAAFSLTGIADQLDLELTAWIGEDDIVREFDLQVVEKDGVPVEGSGSVTIEDANEEVEAPDAPPADDVLTGPEAEAWLQANLR